MPRMKFTSTGGKLQAPPYVWHGKYMHPMDRRKITVRSWGMSGRNGVAWELFGSVQLKYQTSLRFPRRIILVYRSKYIDRIFRRKSKLYGSCAAAGFRPRTTLGTRVSRSNPWAIYNAARPSVLVPWRCKLASREPQLRIMHFIIPHRKCRIFFNSLVTFCFTKC